MLFFEVCIFLLVLLVGCQQWYLFRLKKALRKEFSVLRKMHRADKEQTLRFFQSIFTLQRKSNVADSLPALVGWRGAPDFICEIIETIEQNTPKLIVECGSGCTTMAIAHCLKQKGCGRLISLEHDPDFAHESQNRLEQLGLAEQVEIVNAQLQSWWANPLWKWYGIDAQSLCGEDEVDMLIVDGPPDATGSLARYPAMVEFDALASIGAVILLDDADRDSEKRVLDRWRSEYPNWKVEYKDSIKGLVKLTKLE